MIYTLYTEIIKLLVTIIYYHQNENFSKNQNSELRICYLTNKQNNGDKLDDIYNYNNI